MRILDKYLYKELTATFFAVLAVLLLITFGTEATRLLAKAVEGTLPASIVFQVLLLQIPNALELILPLVALLSVMLAMGRLYQDREVVVLNSCGIGTGYFQKIITRFLIPMLLLTAVVTLWLTPWAVKTERALIAEAQVTAPLAGLVEGRFNSLPQSNGVLYAQNIGRDGGMTDVWIRFVEDGRDQTIMAPRGFFEWKEERLALVLLDGISYEGLLGGEQLSVREFERFDGFLPELQAGATQPRRQEKNTFDLWNSQDIEERAMLQWRLAVPFSVLVLGLLALKLSKTEPRQGRFAKLFIAIVLYVFYMQSMITIDDWVKAGSWPIEVGLWVVPILFLVFALTSPKVWQILSKPKAAK